jgi:hypothetical protein
VKIHGVSQVIGYTLLHDVPGGSITARPSRYSFEYVGPDDTLGVSTADEETQPPFFIRVEESYEVIQGLASTAYYTARGLAVPSALLVEKKNDDEEFLRLLVRLKLETGGFNVIEKAIAVQKFRELIGKVPDDLLRLLDIPRQSGYIRNYIELSRAPEELKRALLSTRLHENTAFEIFRFPEASRAAVTRFVSGLALGTRKRNEILDMLLAITDGDAERIGRLISHGDLRKIFESGADPPQVAEKAFAFIRGIRYPRMSAYRKRFYEALGKVKIGGELHLSLPKDFERWEFTFSVCFSSVDELKRKIDELKKIAEGEPFEELMRLRV